jgi:hypothetical protein
MILSLKRHIRVLSSAKSPSGARDTAKSVNGVFDSTCFVLYDPKRYDIFASSHQLKLKGSSPGIDILRFKNHSTLNIIESDIHLFISFFGNGSLFIHEILSPKVSRDCSFYARAEMRSRRERCQIIVITITNNNFRLCYVSSKLDQVLLLLLMTNKL